MISAGLPSNEAERLAALQRYGILDTLPETSYDDLVAIAAGICDAPLGSVSLIDADRKWIKSQRGLPVVHMPRAKAFGAHAILRPDEVMVVRDALEDARFSDMPLVTGDQRVRFYAGAPLIATGGAAVGTLCVMDRSPRDIQPFQVDALAGLARQVVSLLELGVAHRELSSHLSEREWFERRLQSHQQELMDENVKLTKLSRTDALTGLPNRRAFAAMVEKAIAAAVLHCTPMALAIVDIDHFKAINDRHGHPAGDAALVAAAKALKDLCGQRSRVARFGGEEFAVVMSDTDKAAALQQCERLRAGIEALPHGIPMKASIGLTTLRVGDHMGSLYARADAALYVAKRGGRNQVALVE